MEEQAKKGKNILLPASILIAGVLIAGSVIYSTGKGSIEKEKLTGTLLQEPSPENVKDVNKKDHIRGNPNAKVVIIEFSDLECPFCQRFHETMKQAVDEFGDEVAWVFRHLPLEMHSKAKREAEASECAAELGGNDAFWKYVDRVFEISPLNNGLDLNLLPQIAEDIGLNKEKFESCLEGGKQADKVEEDIEDAVASGGRGTPYSVIITKNGEKFSIPGALPFEDPVRQDVKTIIQAALEN
ncbi:hypothetical protein CL629_04620 [bacterium]|nr:hypothetical protein [bacterium]|tara:strand:+ start:311 stop:1033 length:723 start_codon:yes stop_codon:yes gene_type:complete